MAAPTEELPRLGRYQVINKIAAGGMAEVFLAKAVGAMGFQRLVAVKLIHANFTRDPEFVKMFIDEARISMNLHHRNIVQVFDLDRANETYFIAMEFVHGVNLYDLYEKMAAKHRWFEPATALYIVAEAAKGLHFAHTRRGPDGRPLGIVHRDISPQNVLLSFEGEVKITDFGIATAAERLHQTAAGIVKGKYAYMAPERLQEKPSDGRVDVFSLGVLLYELLVGENPFAGTSAVDTIENVLNKKIPTPSERGAPVSTGLDRIVMKALARNPAERWSTAQELADALTEYALELTHARKEMAAGDQALAGLLGEMFPEKAKRPPGATSDPKSLNLPVGSGVAVATLEPSAPSTKAPKPKNGRAPIDELQAMLEDPTEDQPTGVSDPADPVADEPTVLRMSAPSEILALPKVSKRGFDEQTTREDLEISDDALGVPTFTPGRRRDVDLSMPTPITPLSSSADDGDKTAPTELPSMMPPVRKPIVQPVVKRPLDPSGGSDDLSDSYATTLPSTSGIANIPEDEPVARPPAVVVPPISVSPHAQGPGASGPTLQPLGPQPGRGSTSNRDFRVPVQPATPQHPPYGAQPMSSYPPPHSGAHEQLVVPVSNPDLQAQPVQSVFPIGQPQRRETRTSTIIAALLLVIAALVVLAAVLVVRGRDQGTRVTAVALKITSSPAGAAVTVDGQLKGGVTPLDMAMIAGEEHVISVSLAGFAAVEPKRVKPTGEQAAETVHFELAAAAAELGSITVQATPPEAQVFVDGQLRGTGTVTVGELALGRELVVRVEAPGHRPIEQRLTLDRNARDLTMPIVLAKDSGTTEPAPQPTQTPPTQTQPTQTPPTQTPPTQTQPTQTQPTQTQPTQTQPTQAAKGGTRKVQLVTEYGNWANVYYNNRWLGTTPLSETLPIGTVQLRVVNETIRLDKVIRVTIPADGSDQVVLPLK
ncbi:protein kinase [Myxococcota bacterium]|nr:protein kinase [Myxococcota bacterium]